MTAALQGHGVTPVLVQGYTNNSQDFTPIVLAIKKSGADILATYMTNSPDVGIFAKQLRQLGVGLPWVGSPSVVTDTAMKLAGPSLHGTYAVADFTPGSSAEAKSFAEKYEAKYKLDADVYSSWAYDAMHLLKQAIESGKSTEPDKVRAALLNVCGWKGVEGTYCFDKNGDGLHGYNGRYDDVPIDVVTSVKKVVDVEKYYNVERLRPYYESFESKPLFIMTSDY